MSTDLLIATAGNKPALHVASSNDYWPALFADVIASTQFSGHREPGVAQPFETCLQPLEEDTVAQLKTYCAALGIDEIALMTACWQWLLFRCSGESQVSCAIKEAVNACAFPSVAKFDDLTLSIDDWLKATDLQVKLSQQQLEPIANLHAFLASNDLILTSQIELCDANEPSNTQHEALENGDLITHLSINKASSQWQLRLQYAPVHFTLAQAKTLLADFMTLLKGVAVHRWRYIKEISVATWVAPQAITTSQGTTSPFTHALNDPNSLTEVLLTALQKGAQQGQVAIEWQDEHNHNLPISYAMLLQRVAVLQSLFIKKGLTVGDKAGLHLNRQPDMIATMLACLFSGITFVPLEPSFPAPRLKAIQEEAQLDVVIQDSTLSNTLSTAPFNCPCLPLSDSLQAWQPIELGLTPWIADNISANTLAYIMFTSGSTGKPKGVVISHRALVTFLQASIKRLSLNDATRWLLITTMAFDISMLEIFAPLCVTGCAVLASSQAYRDPQAIQAYLQGEQHITVLQATPAFWRMLLKVGWKGDPTLVALCGGEALDMHLAKQLYRYTKQLWNCYGPTEATVWSLMSLVDTNALAQSYITLKHSLQGYHHQVVDEYGLPVSVNMVGELCIQGEALSEGYWLRDDLTDAQFILLSDDRVRSYRTGDKVRKLEDDRFQYLGRFDDQVKLRGFRIELGEIEAQLKSLIYVSDAAVNLMGEGDNAQLVAFIEVQQDNTPSTLTLRKALLQQLPSYMVPSRFITLDILPKTGSGKVDRKKLKG